MLGEASSLVKLADAVLTTPLAKFFARLRTRAHPRTLLERLLPHSCYLCGAPDADSLLCPQCAPGLTRLAPGCPICAEPYPAAARTDKLGVLPCGHCLASPPAYDATSAPFRYAPPLDRLIHALKYQRRLASADFLARHLIAPDASPAIDRVVPVPLSRQRLAERGYNQAYELAASYSRTHGLQLDAAVLRRVRDTPAQVGLHWRERVRNLRGAFFCDGEINGEHVLVIDDVMTSGSTLDEIARTLKAAGAMRVSNRVVARAVRDSAQPAA